MTGVVHDVFVKLRRERRLDSHRMFLYKEKPIQRLGSAFKATCQLAGIADLRIYEFRHTASSNLRRAGVGTTTAMKIMGHRSDRMHRRYNTIEPEDLHQAAAKLDAYRANTAVTPATLVAGAPNLSLRKIKRERA